MNLPYQVVRSDRSTIGITVERDRRVIVRAPRPASDACIAAAVEQKRYWIWQKQRDPHKYPVPPYRKEFVPGETFLYLGRNYSLDIVATDSPGLRLAPRTFQLPCHQLPQARDLFRAWYLAEAKVHLSPRAATLAAALGLSYSRLEVRDLKYRWASCTPGGALIFNWRIVQAPAFVIDYLIAHELAHLLEHNHTPEFWNIVAVHVPRYQKARDWLRHHGDKLEW